MATLRAARSAAADRDCEDAGELGIASPGTLGSCEAVGARSAGLGMTGPGRKGAEVSDVVPAEPPESATPPPPATPVAATPVTATPVTATPVGAPVTSPAEDAALLERTLFEVKKV